MVTTMGQTGNPAWVPLWVAHMGAGTTKYCCPALARAPIAS